MKNKNKNNRPLVSVVIPVYNGASYLEEAVDSVFKSTYKNYEILLINDGSKDTSKELCRSLEKKYKKVRFHSFAKNRGLGRVLNYALKYAKGKYICRINQDDTMSPDRIQRQVEFMTSHPEVTLLGSWLMVKDENGDRRINKFLQNDKDIKKTWLKLSPVWDAAVMYSRKTALKVGGYDQSYWPADDLHMWYRLGAVGKIANIQLPLTTIKFHAGATSLKHHRKHMLATYRAHRFAHKHIQRATLFTQIFWIGQLVAGYLFSARFNWFVYRLIKTLVIYRPALKKGKNTGKNIVYRLHSKYASI
jgi:glycosyltransferase involved in cell wall biosynthesis